MKRIRILACVVGAALGASASTDGFGQLSAKQKAELEAAAPSSADMKAQKEMMDRLKKETDDKNALLRSPAFKPGLGDLKPAPIEVKPLEPQAPTGVRAARSRPSPATATPPPASRVIYGETRSISASEKATPDTRPGKVSQPNAAAPRAPERAPCVFKPVMTDEEIAACR